MSAAQLTDATDEQLMLAYREGDQAAFGELFSRYAERLMHAAMRIVDDEASARDVVQQAFLQMHRARNDFDGKRRFRPWIYTIALNLARDERRRRGRRREDELNREPESRASDGDPDAYVATTERRRRMAKALETLSEEQRQVVVLHWYEGLSFPEIAETTGAGLSAVKVRAHRAYKKLKAVLTPDTF
ncbi:MAG: RNA polymerase sigma factor [Myxococcota bacterium]